MWSFICIYLLRYEEFSLSAENGHYSLKTIRGFRNLIGNGEDAFNEVDLPNSSNDSSSSSGSSVSGEYSSDAGLDEVLAEHGQFILFSKFRLFKKNFSQI